MVIGPGIQVTLHFSLSLASGEEIDSTKQPAVFVVGDGNLPAGFEQLLLGLQAGDERSFQINPEQGFGEAKTENVRILTRKDFPADMELLEGLVVSFADHQKTELPGVVKELKDDKVIVDFNHPLSGKDLLFEVRILELARVSDEIARSG